MRAERLALEPIVDRCSSGADGSTCAREGSVHRVQLWGGLPDGWAGNFALHACALGLEIVSGDATRLGSTRWAAAFAVRPADPGARVACHDFLHMARRAPRVVPPLPEPDVEIAWSEAPDAASGVTCRVTGRDAIGLLAEVLRRFDALGLRPCEFSIRTSGDEVDDWFRLERVRSGPRRGGELGRARARVRRTGDARKGGAYTAPLGSTSSGSRRGAAETRRRAFHTK